MAKVYLKTGCKRWYARIKLWDAEAGKWVWKSQPTGVTDKAAAERIAAQLQGASQETKDGRMTRERAEFIVATILQLAGSPWGPKPKTMSEFGGDFITGKMNRAKDFFKAKFNVHWKRFVKWAGPKIHWPLENWTAEHMSSYYANLLTEYSERTASDHLSTFRTIFDQAAKRGMIRGNPAELVEKKENASVVKRIFTRKETADLLRAMRSEKRKDWCLLTLLGWHTGHRIQDLLSLDGTKATEDKAHGWILDITPAKKRHIGGRTVVLPIPRLVATLLCKLGNLQSIHGADNTNGRASTDFANYMLKAGIDPLPVDRGKRKVNLKSFHSFRHSMASRLTAAGVSGEVSRLVTDHDSAQVQKRYVHAEIASLDVALQKARRMK